MKKMTLKNQIITGAIAISGFIILVSTLAVAYIINQQNMTASHNFLKHSFRIILDDLSGRQANLLSATRQLAATDMMGSTLKYIHEYAKPEISSGQDFNPYQSSFRKIAYNTYQIGKVAHVWEITIYDQDGDLTAFALHPEEAVGFFDLLAAVQTRPPESPSFLKGQVVGPVTFAGMVKDQQGKAILFDRELSQAVTQGLALKAAWQAQEIRNLGKQAVIFFDEPYLTGFGSAFMPISRAEVVASLTEAMETCRQHGEVLFGIHCCGNTDWSMLLETPIDILSFDAYGYFDTLILYEQSVENFLARGGYLAWGVVPTSPTAPAETVDQLWKRFQEQVIQLEKTGLDRKTLLSQSLLTPACGLAYLTSEQARQALISLADLSTRARDWQESI